MEGRAEIVSTGTWFSTSRAEDMALVAPKVTDGALPPEDASRIRTDTPESKMWGWGQVKSEQLQYLPPVQPGSRH